MLHLYRDVLQSFHSLKVKYVIIGGIAVGAHGVPRNTFDLDILIEATEENAQRLLQGMIHARLGTATLTTAAAVATTELSIFRDRLRIDVQTKTPGLRFTTAWKNRVVKRRYGFPIYFVSRKDLIRSKRASGREVDIADVHALMNRKRK